ncbi:MAG: biotin carboxylase [Actinomycetota bacterium]|nr:biotin carboxylase [Actinomycetota bacterium]
MHSVAPISGTVLSIGAPGDTVVAGAPLAVLESMKMEYPVAAEADVRIVTALVAPGTAVTAGQPLLDLAPSDDAAAAGGPAGGAAAQPAATTPSAATAATAPSGDGSSNIAPGGDRDTEQRRDVAEVIDRHHRVLDERRPEAVERRRGRGQRTARENISDLVDPGSFVEYGPLVVAAQRSRRSTEDLIDRTPADGLIAGVGTVDGVRTAVLSYDATVLAGTQGYFDHHKKDRLFDVIERERLPVVFFTEGGGGRPGDTDVPTVSGLDVEAFRLFARLSALVPLVGVASGRCFAGNAALLGCCDVIIATEGSNIAMGGPAMIEGGGLGVFTPEQVGPLDVQVANGVVDIAVADEAEAVWVARRYLAYFTVRQLGTWSAPDQRRLRDVVPEQRREVYDVRTVLPLLADDDSVLEVRAGWAPGMVTALARVDGTAFGIVANQPLHLAGAIDSEGADKAARFMQLCDAHDLPILFLCDTPGFMVGPEAEEQAAVRHVSRMFVTGANLQVPIGTIILRKGYGLGAMAMAGGSFRAPLFCVAWPTGEIGGMGLEGAVRLGFRDELAAIEDDDERERTYQHMVEVAYERGRALHAATMFELDDVIDPADSRRWITTLLTARRDRSSDGDRRARRPNIDTW